MRIRNTADMEKMREILKLLMARHKDSAYDLERKSGVGQPTIFRFLQGKIKYPTPPTVRKLARAYGVTESQLRGEAPIDGIDVPNEPLELRDILPPEELKLLANIKKMNPEERVAVIELAEMLAKKPEVVGADRRKSVISEKNQHLRAGDKVHFSPPRQNRIKGQQIATRTGTRA